MKSRVPMCCTASAARRSAPNRAPQAKPAAALLHVLDGGQRVPLDLNACKNLIESACEGLGADVTADPILAETKRNLYDGVPIEEVYKASILAARTLIEKTQTTPTPPRACCCTPSSRK
jgi:hypothetical protein